jgi:hypothetical protein
VRLYRRTDGTVLTADCPVGLRRARFRKVAMTSFGSLILLGAWVGWGVLTMGSPRPNLATATMGEAPRIEPLPTAPLMGALAPPPVHEMGKIKRQKVHSKKPVADPNF